MTDITECAGVELHESVKYLVYIASIYEELGYRQKGSSVFQDVN